jgi:MFS family permease
VTRLGLRENARQFCLLLLINAFVGAMVGLERSILPRIAEEEFALAARAAILSFILVFGVTKALANYAAGHLADRYGRRRLLLGGWLIALPVPFLLMWAPTWGWIVAANALLGISQGLTWSTTVIMKIDLVGPARRGLAMGLNECAGYLAVAGAAFATSAIAARTGLRPEPFYLGVAFAVAGLALSIIVRDTAAHVRLEESQRRADGRRLSPRQVFWTTTVRDPTLSSATQAGLVNNLNDGVAWGLFPLYFAAAGLSITRIGVIAAVYPAVWGILQVGTGALSDRVGRKRLIVAGMWIQAAAIALVGTSQQYDAFLAGGVLLGVGTALVYPTLLAAVSDRSDPPWRARAVGTYRLWRDLGYAAGAVAAGVVADRTGTATAIHLTAALTFASGLLVAIRMSEPAAHARSLNATRIPASNRPS